MRYPASETAAKHHRILEAASALFRQRGFSGVSVGEIMRATGLTHGPFYNHFASKEALMAESLEQASARSLADLDAAAASPDGLAAYLQTYLSEAHRDAPESGCLIAALGGDIGREPGLRSTVTRHLAATFARLAGCFPGSSQKAARQASIRLFSTLVGALVLARAVDDPQLSAEILRAARDGLPPAGWPAPDR